MLSLLLTDFLSCVVICRSVSHSVARRANQKWVAFVWYLGRRAGGMQGLIETALFMFHLIILKLAVASGGDGGNFDNFFRQPVNR